MKVIENGAFVDKLSNAKILYSNSNVEDFWHVNLSKPSVSSIRIVQVDLIDQKSFTDEDERRKQMADNTSCAVKSEFNIRLNETVKRGLASMYLQQADERSFILYRKLAAFYIAAFKFSTVEKGKMMYHLKMTFKMKSGEFDGKYVMIVQKVDVNVYDWQMKVFSKYSILNSALILKVVRLLSMENAEMGDSELYKIMVAPFNTNMPLKFSAPQLIKENAFLTNIYFDELLLCMVADKKMSLTLHRFDKKKGQYYLYPGTVNGLAKLPETSVDYNKSNNFDLTAMPQEFLKYMLITSHHTRDQDISKYHNVVTLRHDVRRTILGAGMCDVRFDIFLTVQAMNQFKQATSSFDIEINASNSELFYAGIATRIVELMRHELNRPGNAGIANLNSTLSNNPFRKQTSTERLSQKFENLSLKVMKADEGQSDISIESTFKESQKKNRTIEMPTMHKKIGSLGEVVGETQFVYKLLRMKAETAAKSKSTSFIGGSRPTAAPRLFKESETVMFKLSIFPTHSRTAIHKLVLSSADVSAMLNIGDFFVEGLGKTSIDLKTIAWVSGLDAKVIFNYFCTFITNRIMMKRWVLFRRPFVFYSKDITRRMYLHQNDMVYSDQKITPKMLPFLRVQALDYEYVYHRVVRHGKGYLLVSVISKHKDKIYTLRVYVQASCRTYTCNFRAADIADSVEDFLCGLSHLLLTTQVSELPRTANELLRAVVRILPKKIVTAEIPLLPENMIPEPIFDASTMVVNHLQSIIEDRFARERTPMAQASSSVKKELEQARKNFDSKILGKFMLIRSNLAFQTVGKERRDSCISDWP